MHVRAKTAAEMTERVEKVRFIYHLELFRKALLFGADERYAGGAKQEETSCNDEHVDLGW